MGEIKRQSINNTVLSYIGAVLGFAIIYLQPFLIPASDIGLLRLMYSFSWMSAVLMPLGVGSITMRFFPKIRNDQNVHNGFFGLLFLITSAGALIIGTLLALNKGYFSRYYERSPEFSDYFSECLVFAYVLALISVYTIYSSVLFKTTFTVFLTDVFTRLGQLAVVVLYHYQVIDKETMVLGYIGVFVLQLLLLIIYLIRHNSVSFKMSRSFYRTLNMREVAMFGFLMMLTAFASLGIKVIDQLMVGHFKSEHMVGIYATSVMMCAVMEIPFNSLERIAQPKISYAWNHGNIAEVSKIYELSSRYMFFAGGVLFCVLWASIDLIYLYLPPEYHIGKLAFYIISISSLINLLTGVNSSVIMFSHKYFAASFFLFVMIAVSFTANNLLIEDFGITGAATATLLAIGSFNLLKYVYILIRFQMQPLTKHTAYIAGTTALCILFIVYPLAGLHPFLRAVCGCAFTAMAFSVLNWRTGAVEEVNKVWQRFGIRFRRSGQ